MIQKGYLNNQNRILLLKSSLTKMCEANRKHTRTHTCQHEAETDMSTTTKSARRVFL